MSHPSLAAATATAGHARRRAIAPLFERPLGRTGRVAVALLLVGLSLAGWFVPGIGPWPAPSTEPLGVLVSVGTATAWAIVTLLALASRDTFRFGWLLVASAVADQIWLLGFLRIDALYFVAENFKGLATVVFAHVLVAFPSGRLRRRYDRWLVGGLYAYFLVGATVRTLIWEPGFSCEIYCPRNPFALLANEALREGFDAVTTGLLPLIALAVALAVLVHWRRASPAGRRALLPVALATPFAYAVTVAGYVGQNTNDAVLLAIVGSPAVQATSIVMPLAMLVGLLSTRLARGNVAALAVELARGVPVGGLRDVLARALRDPTLVVAFPAPDGDGFVDPDGHPVALPDASADRSTRRLERDGGLLAVLVHDPAVEREDPGLIDAVASVARLSLEHERLSAQVRAQLEEVRASRDRIAVAADVERRRVQRDLHDGAQQRLVALAARLEAARNTTATAQAVLDDATAELRAAITEVRELARGVQPAIPFEGPATAAGEPE